ncbi:MAG: DUF4189 domain-containing protein [Rhizonema sp. PD37]|nr:DUF4189 domain-containing protein [Rhizonema sp. PD37]
MHSNNFRVFSVITGLSLLTTIITVPRPAAAGQYYGALAIEKKTGAYGFGVNHNTKQEAIDAASRECNSRTNGRNDCEGVWFSRHRCGAIAKNGTRAGYGLADSASSAGDTAIQQIGGGRVVATACNRQ